MEPERSHDGNTLASDAIRIKPYTGDTPQLTRYDDTGTAEAPCSGLFIPAGGTVVVVFRSGNTAPWNATLLGPICPFRAAGITSASDAPEVYALY